jgi:hypothetical protein
MGIVKALAILLAAEVSVFLLGCVIFFIIGASSGGMQEGLRMASGVLYSWFAFAVLGFLVGAVCAAITILKHK